MRVGVVACGRFWFQAMTEITAGDEGHTAAQLLNRGPDTITKTDVIFGGKKTVAQCDDPTAPTVTLQEIERHRRSMIEIESLDFHHDQMLFRGSTRNFIQQLFVKFSVDRCRRGAEVCKVAIDLRPGVSNEGIRFERRVRRNDHHGFGLAADHALSELRHCVD